MKILLWLDFDCYTWINLGIAQALQGDGIKFCAAVAKKADYDFIKNVKPLGIVDVRDYSQVYDQAWNHDPKMLAALAKKYDINTWLAVYGEREFYKYWTMFGRFTDSQILGIIYNTIRFFESFINDTKPDLVIMQQVGEDLANVLLYKICKAVGIQVLMTNQVYTRDTVHISNNPLSMELSHDYENQTNSSNKNFTNDYIKSRNRSSSISTILNMKYPRISLHYRVAHFINREHTPISNPRLGQIKFKYRFHRQVAQRQQYIDRALLKHVDLGADYYYYPLATEPEARILHTSPFYMNEITNVENVAKALPLSSLLYVKEHPAQKIKGWRDISSYQQIMAMPNVRLIHPDYDSTKLIEHSRGVIALSGGTAFEALFYKKPVILFGDEYYDRLPMVDKVGNIRTLPSMIASMDMKKFNQDDLDRFMSVFEASVISIPYHTMLVDGAAISISNKYMKNHARTKLMFDEYYNKYKESFFAISSKIKSRMPPIPAN